MLRAEQNALIQEANQQLLSIRKDELDYFVQVFSDFGTQAALIAGFTLSTLTQVPTLDSHTHMFWQYLFWISCAIVMVASLHVVLTTTFINIFGSGLALRGPAGSMVRAVEGMIKELDAIFIAFFVSIFFFQTATAATSFVVMEKEAAWIALAIYIIGSYIWYKYCIRIFNRFKVRNVAFAWKDDDDDRPGPRNSEESAQSNYSHVRKTDTFLSNQEMHSQKPKKTSIFGRITGRAPHSAELNEKLLAQHGSDDEQEDKHTVSGGHDSVVGHNSKKKCNNFQEGYLTVRGLGKAYFAAEWTRFYFVFEGDEFFYYKSKEIYKMDPKKSVKNRPISLTDYVICTMKDEKSGALQIILEPYSEEDNRRKWEFRCDTMEELKQWVTAFWKGGIQLSEDFAGLYKPPSTVDGRTTVVGAKSVATGHSKN